MLCSYPYTIRLWVFYITFIWPLHYIPNIEVFLSALQHYRGQSCRLTYSSSKDDMLAAGDLIMCRYVMHTEGYDVVGAVSSCVQHGMMQCRFNKHNKMIAAEMMFDVMGFMQQLQVCIELVIL